MDTMRIISPWIVVAAGLCFAVYMALIDRRMRRPQTPHLDGPTTASGRTEDFRRRHIEAYIAGDIALDELMEKLRRCGPPKAKLPSPPAAAPSSIGIQIDHSKPVVEIPLLDPFCGMGSLLGSSALASYTLLRRGPIGGTSDGIQLPAINIWYRHCDGDGRLLRMMSFHWKLYLEDESLNCCAFTDKAVVPASPKAGEWWTLRSCAKHGYVYMSDAPSKWQCDSMGTVSMLDRVACGCVAPSNFGKGPSGSIASAVGSSGGSGIAGATGPAGRGAGV